MTDVTERDGQDLVFDLDILRGWRETRDDGLRTRHALPRLASLVCHESDDEPRREFPLHGPEAYVGRYHPQNGPVDVILGGLPDHEIYKLSAPHVRIVMSEHGAWTVRPMTPAATTELNGTPLVNARQHVDLQDGDVLKLGALDFHFQTADVTYDEWLDAKREILVNEDETGIFLMRAGGIAGPSVLATSGGRVVIGRSFPEDRDFSEGPWQDREQPGWDLAGLYEWERKFIGFRHAAIVQVDDQWYIEPISLRQRTFVNRLEVTDATPLMPGDEIGLGSVLFHFHDPSDLHASTESHTAELPAVVNWREEQTSPRLTPIDRDTGDPVEPDDEGEVESTSGVEQEVPEVPEDDSEEVGGDE